MPKLSFKNQNQNLSHQLGRLSGLLLLAGALVACGGGGGGADVKSQSITFDPVADQTVGVDYTLLAKSSANLPISYTASPSTVCRVSGSTLTPIGVGPCAVTASQAGNGVYAAAADVKRDITVNAAAPSGSGVSAADGKTAFNTSCVRCHNAHPNISGGAARAVGQPALIATELIATAINSKIGAMSGLGPVDQPGKISTQNINDIAAYLAAPY